MRAGTLYVVVFVRVFVAWTCICVCVHCCNVCVGIVCQAPMYVYEHAHFVLCACVCVFIEICIQFMNGWMDVCVDVNASECIRAPTRGFTHLSMCSHAISRIRM